jgi:hypothetical protein
MTRDEINRSIAEKLGICWHKPLSQEDRLIKNGKSRCYICKEWFEVKWNEEGLYFPSNPNFFTAAGKIQLLREMRKREDWLKFLRHIGGCRHYRMDGLNDFIPIAYITDYTGLLARAAEEFMEEKI